ncbi:hypothetical protein C8024_07790 [Sphingopyxis sp. BSNA05]|uniref:PH domain-containing protein n=1 Tax=Sphingopyxis sp. BSNA05 TaxID=1236614 RepID=UPI0015654EBF|nr:PH domain-containing protein [Sphingopyxis sp. BSNA05]NRD89369.1 hypothetical protein [Sphingopyxis sp. BSNA05]
MRIGGALIAIISLILVGVVSGIVRTFVREYGFRLDRVDTGQPGLRRRRGLFTLTDMVMPIHRVQAAILQTGPVRARFGWYHLKFTSLAGDGTGETDHSAAPCATLSEIEPILDECAIRPPAADLLFHGVNPAFWWRDAIMVLLVLAIVATGNGLFVHPGLYAIILVAIPVGLIQLLNWRHHQYALHDGQLYVRTGWWRRRLTILPIRKIQSVDVSQRPLDHPLQLATLTVGIAGGSAIAPLRITAIGFREAMDLRDRLLRLQNQT